VLLLNTEIIPGEQAIKSGQPAKSSAPTELYDNGVVLSPQARVSLQSGGQTLEVVGDNTEYGDQFASAPISVRKNTDYVLVLPVSLPQGSMGLKIMSADRSTNLAIGDLAHATMDARSVDTPARVSGGAVQMTIIEMPFASGDRTEVRIVLSNNGTGPVPALLGTADVFETGPTPYVWTGYPRMIVSSIQGQFTTGVVLSLVAVGIGLLLLARRGRTLLILLVVPLYYLILQSPLHTEYRYILAIHYFLFVMAGVTLGCFGAALGQASSWVIAISRKR
jgi:hypothetical protein